MIPGNLKLKTITAPGKVLSASLLLEASRMIPEFCKTLGYRVPGSALAKLGSVRFIPLTKSTPSCLHKGVKVSGDPRGILMGAIALVHSPVIVSFRYLANLIDPVVPNPSGYGAPRRTIGMMMDDMCRAFPLSLDLPIGKLGFKLEAAGKVRVFAMVECWTQ